MVGGIGSRHEAREEALSVLYEADIRGVDPLEVLEAQQIDLPKFASDIVRGVTELQDRIDTELSAAAVDWTVDRMPAIDRTLLRMAVFELVERLDVPTAAVVSEAVELASQYSTESSGRFVNGVLAHLAVEIRGDVADP
ncbi:MAG: transcription antitermination factor NusB [Acidimicrobiales bacterium]